MRIVINYLFICVCLWFLPCGAQEEDTIHYTNPIELNINLHVNDVNSWVDSFSKEIINITQALTDPQKILSTYDSLCSNCKTHRNESYTKLDMVGLISKTAQTIRELFDLKRQAVEALAKKAEELNLNHTYDKYLQQYDYMDNKLILLEEDVEIMSEILEEYPLESFLHLNTEKNPRFNNMSVNMSMSTVHVPTDVFNKAPPILNGIKWSEELDKQFVKNFALEKEIKWQYFCSSEGFFRIYPGIKWPRDNKEEGIDFYDCRSRPWYVQASTSPKNLILLVDVSGSMKGLRMQITRSTIKKIMETLSVDDNFNVIQFSDEPRYVDPCFERVMISATMENKKRVEDYVMKAKTNQRAFLDKALEEAFYLFDLEEERRNETLCNKIVMVLTDGAPATYEEIFRKHNWKNNNSSARVFTYLIGKEVSDNRMLKWMACANRGFYSHISSLADIQEHVQLYLKVLSRPMAMQRQREVIYTPMYADYITEESKELQSGLKFMTSIAMPVYDLKNSNYPEGRLLGVVGTDVTVDQIKARIPLRKLGPLGYAFMVSEQGFVIFHPNLRAFYHTGEDRQLKGNYTNYDITQVEYSANREEVWELRKRIIHAHHYTHFEIKNVVVPFDKKLKRIDVRDLDYHIYPVQDTPYKLVMVVPVAHGTDTVNGAAYSMVKGEVFGKANTRFANWRYCGNDDILYLNGPMFRTKLRELFKRNKENCSTLEYVLAFELSHFILPQRDNLNNTWQAAMNKYQYGYTYVSAGNLNEESFYESKGIEQLFFGSRSGFTFYKTFGNVTDKDFFVRNTKAVTSPYFRRTLDGFLNNYNVTISLPGTEAMMNPESMVLTVTMPIAPFNKAMLAVVGMQMKYTQFQNMMFHNFAKCSGIDCVHCGSENMLCQIIDENGYIVLSKDETEIGLNIANISDGKILMERMVELGIFQELVYTDYQAICESIESSSDDSSAASLLNPFKWIFQLLIWMCSETVFFISKWNLASFFGDAIPGNSLAIGDYYDASEIEAMSKREREQLLYVQRNRQEGTTVKVLYPCHKNITMYKFRMSNLILKQHFSGTISGCQFCARTYSIKWITGTNLIFIASEKCKCEPTGMLKEDEEDENSSEKLCKRLHRTDDTKHHKSKRHRMRKRACADFHLNENYKKCGQCQTTFSWIFVTLCFVSSILGPSLQHPSRLLYS